MIKNIVRRRPECLAFYHNCFHYSPFFSCLDCGSSKSVYKIIFPSSMGVLYPNNKECKWLVKAPKKQFLRFSFQHCMFARGDFLEIRDGLNESAALIVNFTILSGTKQCFGKATWTSSGRYLWVRFKSDKKDVSKGFYMYWNFVERGE